jgi:hypothetical protein
LHPFLAKALSQRIKDKDRVHACGDDDGSREQGWCKKLTIINIKST